MADAIFMFPFAFAALGPLYFQRRGRLSFWRAIGVAFAPATLSGVAALIASQTAWGHRGGPTGDIFTLEALCLLLALAGIVGMVAFVIAYLVLLADRRRSPRNPEHRDVY